MISSRPIKAARAYGVKPVRVPPRQVSNPGEREGGAFGDPCVGGVGWRDLGPITFVVVGGTSGPVARLHVSGERVLRADGRW